MEEALSLVEVYPDGSPFFLFNAKLAAQALGQARQGNASQNDANHLFITKRRRCKQDRPGRRRVRILRIELPEPGGSSPVEGLSDQLEARFEVLPLHPIGFSIARNDYAVDADGR